LALLERADVLSRNLNMTHALSDAEKQIFKNATARRREAGIRLKRFCISLDSNQVESVNMFWDSFVRALGKQKAGDYFVVVMRKADEALQRAIEDRKRK